MENKRKEQPVTIERVETALDILAGIIANAKHEEALLLAPLWRRLVRELTELRDAEDAVAEAIERHSNNIRSKI